MYEPGFLATRLSWLSVFLRRVNAGPLFVSLGMLPIENELSSREIAAFAWAVARRHGPLPLAEIFDERVSSRFPAGATSSDLGRRRLFAEAHRVVKISTVREPYRREILDETRAQVEIDLTRMEDVVRRGGTFYLTPEGHYSTDGRMLLMRGAAERLAPLATIYVAGVSYDPFVARRFSMLYQMVRYGALDPQRDDKKLTTLSKTLAAIRPVVTSQLLGKWLDGRDGEFTVDEAVAGVQARALKAPAATLRRSRAAAQSAGHGTARAAANDAMEDSRMPRRPLSPRRGPPPPAVSVRRRHRRLPSAVSGGDDCERRLRGEVFLTSPSFEGGEPHAQRGGRRALDASVGADHSMRGHEEIERRGRHRSGHPAMRQRPADGAGDVGIRNELTELERRDGSPNRHAKERSLEFERQIETA